MRKEELNSIVASVRAYLDLERESGVEEYYFASDEAVAAACADRPAAVPQGLDELKKEVLACRECDLCQTRTNVVFGAGNPKAKLMFVGEAPGEQEDKQGLPFVGRAGQLLTKIIEAMGLKREDVYIANILKCRPPNNRAPLPAEIIACRNNVKRQVEMINPRVICTLGKFASQTFLNTETPISALRGIFREYNGIKVMPTFHPAYLLRNPDDKKIVWGDMKKVMKELE
ncbi:MAG: uracil-DNA glycosylase [Candidatus Omnitrophica bacterium]|nr:uracil-DNA glycosylase [Candidatus Omnitrophota bacterium]